MRMVACSYLKPTALVHERAALVETGQQFRFQNRAPSLLGGEAMRGSGRSVGGESGIKHAGTGARRTLDAVDVPLRCPRIAHRMDEALDRLTELDRAPELVKLCFFTVHSKRRQSAGRPEKAERLWAFAHAWLFREVKKARRGEA